MLIKVLEYVRYESDGWTWLAHQVRDPSWEEIEAAVRRLDQSQYPFLFLRLHEDVSDEEQLEVLRQMHAELQPRLRLPVAPTSSARALRRALGRPFKIGLIRSALELALRRIESSAPAHANGPS